MSSVSSDPLPSPSPSSRARKRSLSQASLDSYLSPTGEAKRSRPASLDTAKKAKKIHKSRRKSGGKHSSKSKTPSSGSSKNKHKTPQAPHVPPTPQSPTPKSPKTPAKTPRSSHMEALKVLNKAKRYRQMDLKKSAVIRSELTQEELEELQRRADEEFRQWQEAWELEKRRRREERMEKLRLAHEQKRLQQLRQKEMMKPREDTLVTDSKVRSWHLLCTHVYSCSYFSSRTAHTHTHLSLSPSLPLCLPSCHQSCLGRL